MTVTEDVLIVLGFGPVMTVLAMWLVSLKD